MGSRAPAAAGVGSEQVIMYSGKDAHIYAQSRPGTDLWDHWSIQDITGARAVDDPQVIVVRNDIHVVYWNEFDSQSHMICTGAALGLFSETPLTAAPPLDIVHPNRYLVDVI